MIRHLVDDVAIGWKELGTDLLDEAPPALVTALTGGEQWPSTTLDNLITPDGSPPVRMTVTEATSADQDTTWGYVLHPHGIEVVAAQFATSGPVVSWDADPLGSFEDPATWPLAAPRKPSAPHTKPPTGASPPAPRRSLRR